MKKLFTLMAAAMLAFPSFATVYKSCPLTVTVNEAPSANDPIDVTINSQENGKYTLELKNFVLTEMQMGIGTIEVNDVEGQTIGNTLVLSTQQTITIKEGDAEGIDYWMGPDLQQIPITLKGSIKNGELNAILNIPMDKDMLVGVQIGKNCSKLGQLPNAGFENFHTATYDDDYTSQEPNGWHSFMSATGSYVSSVAKITHTWSSTDIRDNAQEGNSTCVKIASAPVKAGAIILASANGTITTGRLKAGSMSATNTANCSFLDFTKTDVDGNGDPYYTVLNYQPDSVKVWVKYTAGTGNKNPYATVSAILTNGQYAQDPEEKAYDGNILARAQKTDIASNSKWEQIAIPFTYTDATESPKGALVTISTCAVPSGGSKSESNPDVLYVDDIELVYNTGIKSINVKGKEATLENGKYSVSVDGAVSANDIVVESDGKGAYITKMLESNKNGVQATILVTSNDLKTCTTYKLNIAGAVVSGIKNAQSITTPNGVQAIYNLAGQQVGSMISGQVYIVKTTDGKTKKVIKK